MSRFYVMCALTESELGSFETLELAEKFVSQLDFSEFKPETDIYIHDTEIWLDTTETESYIYCHASDYDDGYVFF